MSDLSASTPGYARYWKAWAALLAVTLLMVVLPSSLPLILIGIGFKVAVIAAVFMHLRDETLDFVFLVGFSILFFGLLLYALMVPDGSAM